MKTLFEAVQGTAKLFSPEKPDSKPPRRPQGYRRRDVEADNRRQLAQAYSYQAQRMRSPEELDALDREYQKRMEEGPDFTHYRSKSDFREPPRHGLDRESRCRLRHRFNAMARGAWEHRKPGHHRGMISRTCKDVFGAFIFLAEKYPSLFPSLERLASLAQCCKQSVVTALAMLEQLGFIVRHRRLRFVMTVLGRKVEQATNAYELRFPERGWGALALSLLGIRRESNNWAAIGTESFISFTKGDFLAKKRAAKSGSSGQPPWAADFM